MTNEHGLHARPAALFVRAAGRFDAETTVRNLTSARGPASARSLNAVATLGVREGDEILVSARGAQAAEAVDALRTLVESQLAAEPAAPPPAVPAPPAPPAAPAPEGALQGLPVSAGTAIGPARRLHTAAPEVSELPLRTRAGSAPL